MVDETKPGKIDFVGALQSGKFWIDVDSKEVRFEPEQHLGSAFVVNVEPTIIVTCAHVLKPGVRMAFVVPAVRNDGFQDGWDVHFVDSDSIAKDESKDLAIMTLKLSTNHAGLRAVPISDKLVPLAERVTAFGCPQDHYSPEPHKINLVARVGHTMIVGEFMSLVDFAPIAGMSGGPVMYKHQAVGVISTQVNFGTDTKIVEESDDIGIYEYRAFESCGEYVSSLSLLSFIKSVRKVDDTR